MKHRFLLPGEYYITNEQMFIETLLGSCVCVCLYNVKNGCSAMNHFLLDQPGKNEKNCDIGRFGSSSVKHIIDALFTVDANSLHYRAHLYGGASIVKSVSAGIDVGMKNIEIARLLIDTYHICIANEDVGGIRGRRIRFNTATNTVIFRYTGFEPETDNRMGNYDIRRYEKYDQLLR